MPSSPEEYQALLWGVIAYGFATAAVLALLTGAARGHRRDDD
jgi:hypothetical protein